MGLYDAVDRGGAGRKKEKTLRRPLLIAAAVFAAVSPAELPAEASSKAQSATSRAANPISFHSHGYPCDQLSATVAIPPTNGHNSRNEVSMSRNFPSESK